MTLFGWIKKSSIKQNIDNAVKKAVFMCEKYHYEEKATMNESFTDEKNHIIAEKDGEIASYLRMIDSLKKRINDLEKDKAMIRRHAQTNSRVSAEIQVFIDHAMQNFKRESITMKDQLGTMVENVICNFALEYQRIGEICSDANRQHDKTERISK